jgi:hypothetical protein
MLDSGHVVPEAVITFVLGVSKGRAACAGRRAHATAPLSCRSRTAPSPTLPSRNQGPNPTAPPPRPPLHLSAPQVFAPFFFTAVKKLIASAFVDPSEPLPARIAAHPELYAVMAERVAHFLAGHPDAP